MHLGGARGLVAGACEVSAPTTRCTSRLLLAVLTPLPRQRRDWRHGNPRAPDALLAFPFAYTRCFLASTRNELFPLRNGSRPLGFLHSMVPGLRRAFPKREETVEGAPPYMKCAPRPEATLGTAHYFRTAGLPPPSQRRDAGSFNCKCGTGWGGS